MLGDEAVWACGSWQEGGVTVSVRPTTGNHDYGEVFGPGVQRKPSQCPALAADCAYGPLPQVIIPITAVLISGLLSLLGGVFCTPSNRLLSD